MRGWYYFKDTVREVVGVSGVPVLHRSSMLNIAHLEHVARSEKSREKNFLLHLEKRTIIIRTTFEH